MVNLDGKIGLRSFGTMCRKSFKFYKFVREMSLDSTQINYEHTTGCEEETGEVSSILRLFSVVYSGQ